MPDNAAAARPGHARPSAVGALPGAGWLLLAVLATGVAVWSMRYGLPVVPQPNLSNFVTRRPALTVHALSASIALLVGPWQFLPGLRARCIALHRALGRTYAVAVLVAWLSSIPIALHAETGAVASAGFLALGAAWIATTAVAVERAMQRDIAAHRRWMVRSYALTAAAITLRIYLGAGIALGIPLTVVYPAIAWLCWVPNLLAAEWWVRRAVPGLQSARRSGARWQSPELD
ncbi:DUF2306 domain-containing protein [Roseomonas populi]|uniref:DUF2306 domain-containing protein n=1 Tax=Roseomonas populi TaxID=3121582 RepID=A0ABT1XAA5_9PROT|nr:DUF2306 domain-containing protein [Roseomonas pecuniae]MCR0985017.1 DUF2306 domain-containing protein [Roseomonas pecuniae]